jgi:hypothetical protein
MTDASAMIYVILGLSAMGIIIWAIQKGAKHSRDKAKERREEYDAGWRARHDWLLALPALDSVSTCKRCGASTRDASTKAFMFRDNVPDSPFGYFPRFPYPPHMIRTCARCDYTWQEKSKDAHELYWPIY